MSVWEEVDAIRKDHDRLASWLKSEHGAWTLQEASGDGMYVVARRASKTNPRHILKARTASDVQQAILKLEADEEKAEKKNSTIWGGQG